MISALRVVGPQSAEVARWSAGAIACLADQHRGNRTALREGGACEGSCLYHLNKTHNRALLNFCLCFSFADENEIHFLYFMYFIWLCFLRKAIIENLRCHAVERGDSDVAWSCCRAIYLLCDYAPLAKAAFLAAGAKEILFDLQHNSRFTAKVNSAAKDALKRLLSN